MSGCIPRPGGRRARAACLGPLALAGCAGSQSALDPVGRGAEQIADLFWWMAGGAAVVWLLVIGLAVYAVRVRPAEHRRRTALLVIGGGAVFPTLVLSGSPRSVARPT